MSNLHFTWSSVEEQRISCLARGGSAGFCSGFPHRSCSQPAFSQPGSSQLHLRAHEYRALPPQTDPFYQRLWSLCMRSRREGTGLAVRVSGRGAGFVGRPRANAGDAPRVPVRAFGRGPSRRVCLPLALTDPRCFRGPSAAFTLSAAALLIVCTILAPLPPLCRLLGIRSACRMWVASPTGLFRFHLPVVMMLGINGVHAPRAGAQGARLHGVGDYRLRPRGRGFVLTTRLPPLFCPAEESAFTPSPKIASAPAGARTGGRATATLTRRAA